MHTPKNKPSKCVMARLTRNGVNYQKNFTLAQHKTWAKAEAAAQRWVKKMLQQLPPPSTARGQMNKRNQSGIVGVYAQLNTDRRRKTLYQDVRWSARWPECPNAGGVSFSSKKYGDDDAFLCAYLARKNETVDREWILKRLKAFKRTNKCKEVLERKKIEFV